MGLASRVAEYAEQWPGGFVAPSQGGPAAGGGAFLPELFGGNARQWVEMAFGADPNADPDTWGWTDVTTSFLWDPGVNIGIGRPPESTRITPASFTGTIRNDQPNGGDWTVGNALSPRWPYVRENTPVRARLDVGNGASLRFQGYAVSWKPTTIAMGDDGNRINVVAFKAAGVARRLFQGTSAPQSPMWRSTMLAYRYPTATNTSGGGGFEVGGDGGYASLPARYWPLEDGYGALQGTDALDAAYSLKTTSFSALPDFGAGTVGTGSKSIAVFKTGASLTANFPPVPLGASQRTDVYAGSSIHSQFLFKLPQATFDTLDAGGAGPDVEIIRYTMSGGTIARWSIWLDFDPGGMSLYMRAYDSGGATLGTSTLFNDDALIDADCLITVIFNQNGANTENRVLYNPLGTTPNTGEPFGDNEYVANDININSQTHGSIVRVDVAPSADLGGMIIGHLAIFNGGEGTFPDITNRAGRGRTGDPVDRRMRRLSIENAVELDIVGTADLVMGVQGIGGYLDLMSECEQVDGGTLFDGLGPGLTYVCRTDGYSQSADLVLDAGDGQVLGPVAAENDDLGRVNSFTANNPAGGQQMFTKETGDLSVSEVGIYDSSGDFRVSLDSTLYDEAAWRVHLGTVTGLRYPAVSFELAREGTSVLGQQWLDSRPYGRLDILDLESGTVDPDRRFLLRSWTERWNSRLWSVTAALSPYSPWEIAVLSDATGDRSEFLFRPAGGYSTIVSDVAAGATSFTVATSSGPVWTTVADDIDGLYAEVAGLKVRVTNITGATSPQTFTVDGTTVLKAISAGTDIDVWQPPALGL